MNSKIKILLDKQKIIVGLDMRRGKDIHSHTVEFLFKDKSRLKFTFKELQDSKDLPPGFEPWPLGEPLC